MEEYSMKDVTATFGLSRSTILYYEKLGLICSSKNPNNGYRIYTHDEINRLKECICLKNLGYSIKEICEILQDDQLDSTDCLEKCITKVNDDLALKNAYLEQFIRLNEIYHKKREFIEVVNLPQYCYLHSGCESGYHEINQSDESNLLIQNVPLTSFVAIYSDYQNDKKQKIVGRCILSNHVSLLFHENHPVEWNYLGGCSALRMISDSDRLLCNFDEIINLFEQFAEKNHLMLTKELFAFSHMPNLVSGPAVIYMPIMSEN